MKIKITFRQEFINTIYTAAGLAAVVVTSYLHQRTLQPYGPGFETLQGHCLHVCFHYDNQQIHRHQSP